MRVPAPRFALPLFLLATLAVVQCNDLPTSSDVPDRVLGGDGLPAGSGPSFAVSDALHSAGNAHFFWLAPIVADPSSFNGPFDATKSPTVRVCDLSDCPNLIVAEFTTTSGLGSETIRVVPEDEHYIVNWHTDLSSVGPGPTYRIRVLVAGTQLGYADVQFGETGKNVKNITTDDVVGLKDGRTLPIKFRIEEGAVFVVSAAEGGKIEAAGGSVSLDVPPGAVQEEIGITVQESTEPTNRATVAYEFGPPGTVFVEPITVTLAYDPGTLPPGVSEDQLGLHFRVGDPAEDRWFLQPGNVVDPVSKTVSAKVAHFSTGGVAPAQLEPAQSVAAGASFSCAVNPDGQVFCWGRDNRGALGTDQTTETCSELFSPVGNATVVTDPCSSVPLPVEGEVVFSSLASDDSSICGIATGGEVHCWGAKLDGTRDPVTIPTGLPGGSTFSAIDVSWGHGCGIMTSGEAACWGRGTEGQLGDGSGASSASPVLVGGTAALVTVDAGFFHSCGLTGLGEPFCWGSAAGGTFGDGRTSPSSSLPVPAGGGLTLDEIRAGTQYSCGREADGTAYCWGFWNHVVGQHGTGTLTNSSGSSDNFPVPLAGNVSFAELNIHAHNTISGVNCGLTSSGDVYCWGLDSNGQVGNGPGADVCPNATLGDLACENAPALVAGGLTFAEVDVGVVHVCGRTTAGELYCWGWNGWGQLGEGTQNDAHAPVRVASPAGG